MKTLYQFQAEAIRALYDYFRHNDGNPIIALPTGTGKSFVQAEFIRSLFEQWPKIRILGLTHVQTLISQNFEELICHWPLAPCGVCSTGLGHHNVSLPIVFGGIQTVVSRVDLLGHRDLLLIDECHLLSPRSESQYQRVIARLREKNPSCKVIGFSATPWRLGQGRLTDDGLFTDVAFDMTSMENFNQLLADGYLVPPVAPTRLKSGTELTQFDLSKVHSDGFKYNEKELDAASNQDKLNIQVCREMCELAHDRKSWLIFCASIDHAEQINRILQGLGIYSDVVHSKKDKEHNDRSIRAWKAGTLRCIVNKDMLTTGVNNPACDFIGALRGLVSSSLWVQMLGRGTRIFKESNKNNCLVADFAGNTRRLGPINDPIIPRKKTKNGEPGTPPIRICSECGVYNSASAKHCINCGYEFPVSSKLSNRASEESLIRTLDRKVETFDVQRIVYNTHQRESKLPTLKVSYFVGNGIKRYDDYVCLEHPGYAGRLARDWWRKHAESEPPSSCQEALARAQRELRVARRIHVWTTKKYPEITGVEF